jgi:hypothetical protein
MNPALAIRPGGIPIPLDARVAGLDFTPVRESLWRVTTRAGEVRGHIERVDSGGHQRFAARLSRGGARMLPIGEFWTAQAAAESLA